MCLCFMNLGLLAAFFAGDHPLVLGNQGTDGPCLANYMTGIKDKKYWKDGAQDTQGCVNPQPLPFLHDSSGLG